MQKKQATAGGGLPVKFVQEEFLDDTDDDEEITSFVLMAEESDGGSRHESDRGRTRTPRRRVNVRTQWEEDLQQTAELSWTQWELEEERQKSRELAERLKQAKKTISKGILCNKERSATPARGRARVPGALVSKKA